MDENSVGSNDSELPGRINLDSGAIRAGLNELQRGQEILATFDGSKNDLADLARRIQESASLLSSVQAWSKTRGVTGGARQWEDKAIEDVAVDLLGFALELADVRGLALAEKQLLRWAKDANPMSPKN